MIQNLKKILDRIDTAFSFDLLLIVIIIGFLAYARSLFNGFVGDDDAQIISNETVKHAVDNIFIVFGKGTFTSGGSVSGFIPGVYYKPFMTLCFVFLYFVFGVQPFGYHLFSLLDHLLNVILLFFIARTFFQMAKFHYAQAMAFFLALLFMLAPGISETVFYMANLQDSLVGTFLFISLLLMQRMQFAVKISLKSYVLLSISLFLGMISKESGVVVLALVAVYSWLFIRKTVKWVILIDAIVFLFYLYLRLFVAQISIFNPLPFIPIHEASLWQRILTMPYELFSYMRLVVFPYALFIHQHFVVVSVTDPRFFLTFPVALIVAGFLAYWGYILRSKLYWFFLAWLIFGFGIVMNIIPLDMTFAERWLYLPLAGILFAVFFILYYVQEKWRKSVPLIFFVLCLMISFYFVRTFIRGWDWKDNKTLYAHDVQFNPDSYELLSDYAVTLIYAKEYPQAEAALERSVQLSPRYWPAYSNLGLAYDYAGNPIMAKRYYRLAIDLSQYFIPYVNLAKLMFVTEKPENVVPILNQALALYPLNPNLLIIAAKVYDKMGKEDIASSYAQKAAAVSPTALQDKTILRLINGQ